MLRDDKPARVPLYHSMARDRLVNWRKDCVQARENWLAITKQYGREDRDLAKIAKEEASDCMKHERACTQIIEYIDGKRAGLGQMQGGTYRVPPELASVFRFCAGLAQS